MNFLRLAPTARSLLAAAVALVAAAGLIARTPFPHSIVPVALPAQEQSVAGQKTFGRVVRTDLTADELGANLQFDVALKLRNEAELDTRIARGEILTPAQLQAYLPTPEDYAAIRTWLVGQGFAITLEANTRHAIFAEGSAGAVAAAFGVRLARVQTADGEFTSAISAPELPDEIAAAVKGVRGLQPHLLRRPRSRKPQQLESNTYYAITPAAIASAYQVPGNLTGAGQTIAVIGDSALQYSDLTTFWNECGIAHTLLNVTTVNVGAGPGTHTDDQNEVAMDVEWVSGLAPNASVRCYATKYPMTGDAEAAAYTQILNDLASFPSIHQVTESFGGIEDSSVLSNGDSALPLLAAQGVTCFAASGDGGSNPDTDPSKSTYNSADPLGAFYPASDPYMTAVGGTTLIFPQSLDGLPSGAEVAWSVSGTGTNGSGGAISAYFSRPSWQVAPGLPGGNKRCIPDVAAVADTGSADDDMGPLFIQGGNAYGGGGTSLASPIWAGLCALINESRATSSLTPVGLLNAKIYAAAGSSSFFDVTSGTIGAYQAGTGYDLCTGLGTPRVGNLITFLATPQNPPSITTQPASQTVTDGQGVTFSVVASGTAPLTYQWRFNGNSINGATGTSLSLNPVSPANAGNYDVVVTNSLGSATSAVATLTVNPHGPAITNFSASSNAAVVGDNLTLSVTVSGSGTISYQWTHNGITIPGATGSTLVLNHATLDDSGTYVVQVTDSFGTLVSNPITIDVSSPTPHTQVVAWGDNSAGQTNVPTGLSQVIAIAAGDQHTLALKSDGTVVAWGQGAFHATAVPAGLSDVVAIAAGYHLSLAVKSDGTVVAWGDNAVNVQSGLTNVATITGQGYALKKDGTVVPWYSAPARPPPTGLDHVVALAGNFDNFEVALKSDGTVVAWGYFATNLGAPVGWTNVVAIAASSDCVFGLKADGTLLAWGINTSGEATITPGPGSISKLAAAGANSMVLRANGTAAVFGSNLYGQDNVPASLGHVVALAGGTAHAVALCYFAGNQLPAPDFNNDGATDLIWQDKVTGERRIWVMDGTALFASLSFTTIGPEWSIAGAGNLGGPSKNDLVWQNSATGERSVWLMNSFGFVTNVPLGVVPVDWSIAAVADFNGDGNADLVWQNLSTGERVVWLMSGTNVIGSASLGVVPPLWTIAGAGDFNRDGQTDLVWVNRATGDYSLWLMQGVAYQSTLSLGKLPATMQIDGVRDMNGDGQPDLLVTNAGTAERSIWLMNGATVAGVVHLATLGPEWILDHPQAAALKSLGQDFNSDGLCDLVWQNTATGERLVWFMNGGAYAGGAYLGVISTDWSIAGTGNFFGSGQADVVWQNSATGERLIWEMNGSAYVTSHSLGVIPVAWSIAAIGDFNGDGQPDLVWQNSATGERVVWFMNGAAFVGSANLGVISTDWSIAAAGDLNSDGQTDLVWQNTATGERVVWLMNGTSFTGSANLGVISTDWSIAAAGDFNADGNVDLVWQNLGSGERLIWLLDHGAYVGGYYLGAVPVAWRIAP